MVEVPEIVAVPAIEVGFTVTVAVTVAAAHTPFVTSAK